jgi:hypothetical protein
MPLRDDDEARLFGAGVIRDLMENAATRYAAYTMDIIHGKRAVASITFGPRPTWRPRHHSESCRPQPPIDRRLPHGGDRDAGRRPALTGGIDIATPPCVAPSLMIGSGQTSSSDSCNDCKGSGYVLVSV